MPSKHALADARAGHDAKALPFATGKTRINRPDAEHERARDAAAAHGPGRGGVNRHACVENEAAAIVERLHGGVHHAAKQALPP
jgi:hypothetical protein